MIALWIAAALLLVSALLIFGWPLLVLGPRAAMSWSREPSAKIVASAFATAVMVAAFLPLGLMGLISGGTQMQILHDGFTGLTWQV